MADNITWDDSDFQMKSDALLATARLNTLAAVNAVAHQLLLISSREVPIHTVDGEPGGDLQNSGKVVVATDIVNPDAIAGYNKVYAAYQHEGMRQDGSHVVKHYTNARSKKKFLEDPMKNNIAVFREYFKRILG